MDDDELHRRIDELVAEEHRLERSHVGRALSDTERRRLEDVSVQLDRYWDLLRQRDARRRAGLSPDDAQERSADVVEGYRQ
jgi:predicted transcriptional regulator